MTYGLPIITPMAAHRTFLAMTTGRLDAPMGGLRLAQRGHAAVSAHADVALAMPAALSPAGSAAGALALSLQLPIGCRA
ncbi:hypothetical protein BAU08_00635 [Bordetella bronchialis]|uniref:Uncharacterized protein n=1 Tax=Bordetella bronchialis TaxID=463025 RepID=A0A193FSK2_9BORD|nr:hypothetical protein BAU06_00645 [Bordetella bronchialis]ANN70049.1 hypothetical protein BAU08_00635 [Bordetella bronchialis]